MKKMFMFTVLFCLVIEQSMANVHPNLNMEAIMNSQPKVMQASLGDVVGFFVFIFMVAVVFGAGVTVPIKLFAPKKEDSHGHGGHDNHGHGAHDSHGGHDKKHGNHVDNHTLKNEDHKKHDSHKKEESHKEEHYQPVVLEKKVEKPHSAPHVEKKSEEQTPTTKTPQKFDFNVSGDFDKEWS